MINLRVLVPEATTNYVKNPSFRLDTTGWSTFGGDDAETVTDNFNRANGQLGSVWEYTNSAWTISTNRAICTPTLGADLITNGTFAVDANWTKGTGWTIAAGVAAHAAGTASNINENVLTVEKWYKTTWDLVTTNGSNVNAIFGSQAQVRVVAVAASQVDTNRVVTSTQAGVRASAAAFSGTIDNVTYKEITLSDMFATIAMGTTANIFANVTLPNNANTGAQAGVAGWLNSYTAPTDFIIAYILPATTTASYYIKLVKCVGGVYTELISNLITYVADAKVEIRGIRAGANLTLTLWYNNTQVSSAQVLTDATIINNIRHGLFSSNEGASFGAVQIESSYSRASLATLTRSLDRARFGIASGKIVTNGDMLHEGVYYKVSWLNGVNDILTASVYARGGGKIRLRLGDAASGMNYISKPVNLNDAYWTRIEVSGRCAGGNDVRLWVENDNPLPMVNTFYIDGAQLERKAAATSYCDGDQEGCRWNTVAHTTLSTRSADTRAGGRWVPLAGPCRPNNDIYVTVLGGFGMPPVTNNIQTWANSPGAFFQNQKIQNRVVTLSFHVKREALRTGGRTPNLSALHELRQQLIDLIKPDVTLDSEAFLFEYSDEESGKPLYLRMRYEAGLEGEWDIRNRWYNSFPVRLLAVDPLWSEDSQDVMQLGIKNTFSGTRYDAWVKQDGEWSPLRDATTGDGFSFVTAMAVSPDGTLYVAEGLSPYGIFTWDGSNITLIGTITGGNPINSIAIAPDGIVYITGTFTAINGVAANHVAKYDPSTGTWAAMGTGLTAYPGFNVGLTICVAPNGQVYVGGLFSAAGGVACYNIARWDGSQWRTVGATSGVGGTVLGSVLSIVNGRDGHTLYVGGNFLTNNGGGVTYNGVASLDMDTNLLSPMGYGMLVADMTYAGVGNLAVGLDGIVYAGGEFVISGAPAATPILSIAKYSGGQLWEQLGDGLENSGGMAIGTRGELLVGGAMVDGQSETSKWYGNVFTPVEFPTNAPGAGISSIVFGKNGEMYFGGSTTYTEYEYPKLTTITNNGSASCWPVLYVKGSGKLKYISNVKTGQEIFLDLDVFGGEEITIDFAKGSINSAARGNLNYTILPGSEIRSIFLLPGENAVAVLMNNEVEPTLQLRWTLQDWSADAVMDTDDL